MYNLYEPFSTFATGGKIWLISDTHFNDYDEKDWLPTEELLYRIKMKVAAADTLICLGDCGQAHYFNEIKCSRKILIKGNHDTRSDDFYKSYFDQVFDGPLFIASDILLSHEPVYGLDFCLNIHGHMHTGKHIYTDEKGGRHVNLVGPAVDYEPLALPDIYLAGQ